MYVEGSHQMAFNPTGNPAYDLTSESTSLLVTPRTRRKQTVLRTLLGLCVIGFLFTLGGGAGFVKQFAWPNSGFDAQKWFGKLKLPQFPDGYGEGFPDLYPDEHVRDWTSQWGKDAEEAAEKAGGEVKTEEQDAMVVMASEIELAKKQEKVAKKSGKSLKKLAEESGSSSSIESTSK